MPLCGKPAKHQTSPLVRKSVTFSRTPHATHLEPLPASQSGFVTQGGQAACDAAKRSTRCSLQADYSYLGYFDRWRVRQPTTAAAAIFDLLCHPTQICNKKMHSPGEEMQTSDHSRRQPRPFGICHAPMGRSVVKCHETLGVATGHFSGPPCPGCKDSCSAAHFRHLGNCLIAGVLIRHALINRQPSLLAEFQY